MKETPKCRVFGECGGCKYQDIPYSEELKIKEAQIRSLFEERGWSGDLLEPITASPRPYHYRNRLDMSLRRFKDGRVCVGFNLPGSFSVLEITECPIAMEAISGFLPRLKEEACAKLPPDYRTANLTVKTGDDGRVIWGGIGRRSLRTAEADYLWTEVDGLRIHYAMDTFFQANSSILPALKRTLERWSECGEGGLLLDLYSGVGLFGFLLAARFRRVAMIEENPAAATVARFNRERTGLGNVIVSDGRVEEVLPSLLTDAETSHATALVDPPRRGLSPQALENVIREKRIGSLLYLSCHPESLVRDLEVLTGAGFEILRGAGFDFFPKTKHIETLVWLRRKS
ncbi:MAG: class I SAM-dependent RNA methyltransferase [Candidatus Omnitrophica bacterium]|nr:class I SAM-dependent RNA methyltransferase [Candidatus Omnitrophota bacterium]